jgi:hypothetical protein
VRRLSILAVIITLCSAALPDGLLLAPAAHAADAPKCVVVAAPRWPGVKDGLQDCTGGNPKTDGAETILSALIGLWSGTAAAKKMEQQGVKAFYFLNRDAANNYFSHTYPYNLYKSHFLTKTAKCGNTAYHVFGTGALIATSTFEDCSLSGSPKNMNIQETALHEAGHAYDFALATATGKPELPPSTSKAFRKEVTADLANDDATWTQEDSKAQQWDYVCYLFSNVDPNALEIALGDWKTKDGKPVPNEVAGPVCQDSSQGMVPVKKWQDSSPRVIGIAKMPYFLSANSPSGPYEDAWAQLFALHTGRTGSPALLPFTDRSLPIVLPCSNFVSGWYLVHGKPPNETSYPPGCPREPATAYNEK